MGMSTERLGCSCRLTFTWQCPLPTARVPKSCGAGLQWSLSRRSGACCGGRTAEDTPAGSPLLPQVSGAPSVYSVVFWGQHWVRLRMASCQSSVERSTVLTAGTGESMGPHGSDHALSLLATAIEWRGVFGPFLPWVGGQWLCPWGEVAGIARCSYTKLPD